MLKRGVGLLLTRLKLRVGGMTVTSVYRGCPRGAGLDVDRILMLWDNHERKNWLHGNTKAPRDGSPKGLFLRSQLRLTGEAVCRALLSIQSFADTKQQQAADDVSHDREQELLKNWMH